MKVLQENHFLLVIFSIFSVSFVYLDNIKPLQMDELATFFHCHDKTFSELIISTNTGVN